MKHKIISLKDRRVILGNFFSLSTLQGINYLLPLITIPFLFRMIGPEKFGLIAFAQAFVQYFLILTDYGFSLSATKEISLCKEHKEKVCTVFSLVMSVKIILAILSFFALLLIINFIPKFKQDWLVYVCSFGLVIGNTLFPVWFFQGTEKMKYISIINIVCSLAYVICVFVFVRLPQDYLYVPLFNSLFSVISGLFGLRIAFRRFGMFFVFQGYHNIKKQMKAGWNIFISIVAINAYTTTRIFAVGLLTNNTITGFYSIAERIANFIQTFPLESFTQAIYPRINKIFSVNKKRAARLMHKIQRSTTITFICVVPVLYWLSPRIVKLVCGAEYEEVATTLKLLLMAVMFVGSNASRVQFLLVSGRTDLYSKLHVGAAAIGLPLVFFLIYCFSYTGAAISTIFIEGGIFITTFFLIKQALKS